MKELIIVHVRSGWLCFPVSSFLSLVTIFSKNNFLKAKMSIVTLKFLLPQKVGWL